MGWLTNLFQGIGNAVQGAGKSVGNFLTNPIQGFSQLATGLGQNAGQNLMGSFGAKPQTPQISMPKMPVSTSPMAQPGVSNSLMAGLGNQSPQGASLLKKINFNTPSIPGATSTAQMPQAQGGNDWFSKMTQGINLPQMAAGAGINLAGNLFAPKVNTPNIKDSANYQAMQNFKGGLAPGMEDAINRNLAISEEEQLRNLRNVYKNARPGTDYTTDSTYQRDLANLQRSQELNKADALAQAGNQYSSQEMNRLSELANADVAQIMLETGMSSQEAEQFKQSFSNIGSMFMQSAVPELNQSNSLMNLFKMMGGQ